MCRVGARFSFRQRLRYRFDNSLSRGIWGVLAWLAVLALAFFLAIAIFILLTGIGPGGQPTTFPEAVWYALTRSLDPGTFSGDEGLGFRLIMLVVTLVGIFLAAAIIGLVSSAIDNRLENLRRGRSLVIEEDHTLVLGASGKLIPIVRELIEANLSERGRAIVVLADRDPVEMSDEIRASIPDFKTSRLIVRSGNPTRLPDLQQGNPSSAKSIIVLREGSDAHVVKSALGALRCLPADSTAHVIAEVEDPSTADALEAAGEGRIVAITSGKIVALIGAQVARFPGLGTVYEELLDFAGDELYTTPVTPAWSGKSFGQALLASSDSTIIGMRRADGSTIVAPGSSAVLADGDSLIAISEDDSRFVLDREPEPWSAEARRPWEPTPRSRERTLIIGWSPLAPLVARELDLHVAPESEIHLLIDEPQEALEAVRAAMSLRNQTLTIHVGDPIQRDSVHAVLDAGSFNHVLLLGEQANYDVDEADARTLLSLLHVHSHSGTPGPENVVAELLDPNDVELTGAAENRDFIVSQRLIALLMAQLSESPRLRPVFDEVFDADGATIVMHPATRYCAAGDTTFRDIVSAGRDWDVVPIGYRSNSQAGRSGTIGNGIRLNPPKDEVITLTEGDAIIALERPAAHA